MNTPSADVEWPKISVVTPSLNQGRFLERTIRSVIDQDYPGLEYFIMDGGSTDDSLDIIRKYEDRLTGWVSEPDEGQADAIGKGFSRCTGDVIAWLNSSDEYLPDTLARVAGAWKERPSALLYGDVEMIGEAGESHGVECTDHLDLEAMLYQHIFPFQPGSFWSREAYEACGGMDPAFHVYMDFDLFIRLAREGSMRYVPGVLARLRKHEDAKTAGDPEPWRRELERIIERHVPGGRARPLRKLFSFGKRLVRFLAQGRIGEARRIVLKAGRNSRFSKKRKVRVLW